MTTTPAAEMRAAAEKLREVAAAATPGICPHWTYMAVRHIARNCEIECDHDEHRTVDQPTWDRYEDAPFIATVHPGVGVALADWLEWQAAALTDGRIAVPAPALAVARQVLGTETAEVEISPDTGALEQALAQARQVLGTVTTPPETTSVTAWLRARYSGPGEDTRRVQLLADEIDAQYPGQQPGPAVTEEGLTDGERQFLAYALHLASDEMASRSDDFVNDDRAALVKLQRLAKAGCTCGNVNEAWIETPHTVDCAATPAVTEEAVAETPPVVAWSSVGSLFCTSCCNGHPDYQAARITALPYGGTCDGCGADIPATP